MKSMMRFARFIFCLVLFLSLEPCYAAEKQILSVLSPLQTLTPDLLKQFEKETNSVVRVGFLGNEADTDSQVRQGSTVWDVVISDELQLRKLVKYERLMKLGASAKGTAGTASNVVGSDAEVSSLFAEPLTYQVLFNDPVGLICKMKQAPLEKIKEVKPASHLKSISLSWTDLTESLIKEAVIGEIVMGISLPVQATLANALVGTRRSNIDERVVYEEKKNVQDPRIEFLRKLHWQTRSQKVSLQAEILNPSVSCVVSYLSKFENMEELFSKSTLASEKKQNLVQETEQKLVQKLMFVVPDGKTVVRRLGIAITEESSRSALALRFMNFVLARKSEMAFKNGLCSVLENERMAKIEKVDAVKAWGHDKDYCRFQALDVLSDIPVLTEKMVQEFGEHIR